MEFRTDKAKWNQDGDGFWVSFRVPDIKTAIKAVQEIGEKLFDVAINLHKEKRSKDANKYCWVLLDKLAVATLEPKTKIYKNLVQEIGGNSEIVCVKDSAVAKLISGWEHNGLGWPTEVFPSKIEGCTNVVLYYGSSTYDTAQMSRLIDLIVFECKERGIETMTPNELLKLKGLWNG